MSKYIIQADDDESNFFICEAENCNVAMIKFLRYRGETKDIPYIERLVYSLDSIKDLMDLVERLCNSEIWTFAKIGELYTDNHMN